MTALRPHYLYHLIAKTTTHAVTHFDRDGRVEPWEQTQHADTEWTAQCLCGEAWHSPEQSWVLDRIAEHVVRNAIGAAFGGAS